MRNRAGRDRPGILVLGDVNVDIMGRVRAWPEPGEACLSTKLEMHCGGVGGNCALGLARWGVPVRRLGCVGRDLFGDYVRKALDAGGVDVRLVQRSGAALTGMFYINVTPDGERTFFGGRGANGLLQLPRSNAALTTGTAGAHIAGHSSLDRGPAHAAAYLIKAIHVRGGWVSLD